MAERRKRALISTVGAAETFPQAIRKVVSELNPDIVAFVATDRSRRNVDKVIESGELGGREYKIFILDDMNNFDEASQVVERAMRWMKKMGVSPRDVSIDFTGGTKTMSSGAVHVGIGHDVGALVYVGGRRGPMNTVIPGHEVLIVASTPSVETARKMLGRAVRMFNRYDYPAALELCRRVREREIGDLENRCRLLELVVRAYWSWDLLDWKRAYGMLSSLTREDAKTLGIIDQWGRNKDILKTLTASLEKNVFKAEQLSDLVASVQRRLAKGEYIEALARVYRSLELLGQIQLWQGHNLDTRDLDMSMVPGELHEKYEKYRNRDGKVRLPLNGCYQLLEDLDHPLGKELSTEEFRNLQYQRNHSAMAHGLSPVGKEDAERGMEYLHDLASRHIKALEEHIEKSRFPRIPEEFAY